MFAVLHTWTQRLTLHPHVHVVIGTGGITGWFMEVVGEAHTAKRPFWFPKAFFAPTSKRTYQQPARKYAQLGDGRGHSGEIGQPSNISSWLEVEKWKLHLERPLAGPAAVVRYLAGYVNRVAIAPSRVTDYDGQHVSFRYTDHSSRRSAQGTTHGFGISSPLPAAYSAATVCTRPILGLWRTGDAPTTKKKLPLPERRTIGNRPAIPKIFSLTGKRPHSHPAHGMTCPVCNTAGSYIYGGGHHYYRDLFEKILNR